MGQGSSSEKSRSAECCPPGSTPFALEDAAYEPRGKMVVSTAEESDGNDGKQCRVYVTGPGSEDEQSWAGKPVLVMCHDIMGQKTGRHRQLADELAVRMGGIVVLPDFFNEEGLLFGGEEENPSYGSGFFIVKIIWSVISGGMGRMFMKHPWEKVEGILLQHVEPLIRSKGVEKFSMMGFCWGAWVVFNASASKALKDKIVCGISFHPSVLDVCKGFKEDDIELCRSVQHPQLVYSTSLEAKSWQPDGEAEKALRENAMVGDALVFTTCAEMHGFMTRGASSLETKTGREIQAGLASAMAFLRTHHEGIKEEEPTACKTKV